MDQAQIRLRDITVELATPNLSPEIATNLQQERDQLTNDINILNQRLLNIPSEIQNAMKTRSISLISKLNQERNELKTKKERLQPEEIIEEITEITLPKTNKKVKSKCFNQFSGGNSPDDNSNEYLTGRKLFVVVNVGSQGETHLLCIEVDQLRELLKDDAQIKLPCIGPRQVYKIDAPESDVKFGRDNDDVIPIIIDTSNQYIQQAKNLYDNGDKQEALNMISNARKEPLHLRQYGISGPKILKDFPGFVPLYKTSIGVEIDVIMLAVQQYFNERPFDKIENLTNGEVDYKNQYVPLSYPNTADTVTGISRAYLLRDDLLSMIVLAEGLQHPESNSQTFPVFEIEYEKEITHTVSRKLIRELRHQNNPNIPTVYLQPEPPNFEYRLDPDSELANLYVSANHCQAGSAISVFKTVDNLPDIYNDWAENNDEVIQELEDRIYYGTDPKGANDWYEYLQHSSILRPHYDPTDDYGEYWPGHKVLPRDEIIIREPEHLAQVPYDDMDDQEVNLQNFNYDQNIENLLPIHDFDGNPIELEPSSTTRPGATRITNILTNSNIIQNRENLNQDWKDFLADVISTPERQNFYGYYLERLQSATKVEIQNWVDEINNDTDKDEEEQQLTPQQHLLVNNLLVLIGLEHMGWNQNDQFIDVYDEGASLIIRDGLTEKLSAISFDDEDFDDVLSQKTTEIINSIGNTNIQGITSEDTRSTFTIRINPDDPVRDIIKQTLIMQTLNSLEIPMYQRLIDINNELFGNVIRKLLSNPINILQQTNMEDIGLENDSSNWEKTLLLFILLTSNKGLYQPYDATIYFDQNYGIRLNQRGNNPNQLLRRTPDSSPPDLSTILSYVEHNNNNQETTYIYADDWKRDINTTTVNQPNAPSLYDELETSYILQLIQSREFYEAVKLIKIIFAKNLLVYIFGETRINGRRIYSDFTNENPQNFQQTFKALSLDLASIQQNLQTMTQGRYRDVLNDAIKKSRNIPFSNPTDLERLVDFAMKQLQEFYDEPAPIEENLSPQEGDEISEEVDQRQQVIDQHFDDSDSSSDDDDDLPNDFYNVFRNTRS